MSSENKEYIFKLRADACENMGELRGEIDRLDRNLVELLGVRQAYMDQAAKIKPDRNMVRDQRRVDDVLEKVRCHAELSGANPELVENLYRAMIEWSINYELAVFDQLKETSQKA